MNTLRLFSLLLVCFIFNYLPAYSQNTADDECKTFCVQTLTGLGYKDGHTLPNAQPGSCDKDNEDEREVCCCSPKRNPE